MDRDLDKKREVQRIFSKGAKRYNLINTIISLGQDRYWRRYAISKANTKDPLLILDLATGTGKMAIEAASILSPETRIFGLDPTREMLEIGLKKTKKTGLDKRISFIIGEGELLPFADETFNLVMVAFGIRNFSSWNEGLKEIYRVLRKQGQFIILEFFKPEGGFLSFLSWIYIRYILPIIGGLIVFRKGLYRYLPRSISLFSHPLQISKDLEERGFKNIRVISLTFGVMVFIEGIKR